MLRAAGMSLIELLVVLAVAGIALGASTLYLRPMEAPLQTGAANLEGFLRQARGRALATTSAYRVTPSDSRNVEAEFASNCGASTWTSDPGVTLVLPRQVAMTDTGWSVCFNSRGLADSNLVISLTHPSAGSRQIEVLRGGAARVLP
jgi:prepilin-type N-terminal cleavage/methylation domain-containing protein